MLSPFYKSIAKQLSSFFQEEARSNEVSRYYLALPTLKYVGKIVDALRELDIAFPFTYQPVEYGDLYETVALTYGDYKYVIASTLNNTHVDFLVKMRNAMSEQQGNWKNASLIMISENMMDSIKGGSRDLTSEGLPLHVSQIVDNLEEMVSSCDLPDADKSVLLHYLKRREDLHYLDNSSFLDFEDVLTWINRKEMTYEDYKVLGYFKDSELSKLIETRNLEMPDSSKWNKAQKEIDRRLQANLDTFENISRLRELGNGEERLVETYDNFGKKLFKDNEEFDYKEILKAEEKVIEKKAIEFKHDEVKYLLVNETGEKQLTDTWSRMVRKRNWDIVIFHPDYKDGEKILMKLPFTRNTSSSYLAGKSEKFVESKGHSLYVNITLNKENYTFERVSYRHENMSTSTFTFKILVLKESEDWFENHRESFSITTKGALSLDLQEENLVFGDGSQQLTIKELSEEIKVNSNGATINFVPGLLDDDSTVFTFTIKTDSYQLPIEIDDNVLKTVPLTAKKVWEMKYEKKSSFEYDDDGKRIKLEQRPFVTHEKERYFYQIEKQWLEQSIKVATYDVNKLVSKDIELPPNVDETYNAFLKALKDTGSIPSMIYYDERIRELAEDYVDAYMNAIESIQDNEIMSDRERNLLYLGSLSYENKIYMTPFSPLNVVYQLQLMKEVGDESIDPNIAKRLNASYTIPFLVSQQNEIYKPDSTKELPEWHEYRPRSQVSIGETNSYLSQVVSEKITQFLDYYEYLFKLSSKPTILLNVINISNDREILKGILEWYKSEITRKGTMTELFSVQVTSYYNDLSGHSAFELFNAMDNPKKVKEEFGFDCSTKLFDAVDVLVEIQKHLSFVKRNIEETPLYSHITFYKMQNKEHMAKQIVQQAPNAMNLGGLYVTTASHRTSKGGYRLGFGTGNTDTDRTRLTKFAKLINELSANRTNYGHDPYKKDNVFSLHISRDDETYLKELYSTCNWLTFIDPSVDLQYFQETSENLVIVHYSDQLSSSNHYDAITVTDKSKQYFKVVEDFLNQQGIQVPQQNIEDIIKTFNTFNGEWLLRAVQNRAHDKREKISIISAIKHALLLFDRSNIIWVPVSMEEIVRVSGNVRLSKKDGLFSGKTTGRKGNCSDDLLLIGLDTSEEDLKMYLYPTEVKIGYNQGNVIDKGIMQVIELKARLNEHLVDSNTFDSKFLRNFFARMFIVNANKMQLNGIWPEKNYHLDESLCEKLLNDEFIISNDLKAEFGDGVVISFKKDLIAERKDRRNGVIIYEIPESVAYKTLGLGIEKLSKKDFSEIKFIEKTVIYASGDNVIDLPEWIEDSIDEKEEVNVAPDTSNYNPVLDNSSKVADNDVIEDVDSKADEGSTPSEIDDNTDNQPRDIEQNGDNESSNPISDKNNNSDEISDVEKHSDLSKVRPLIGMDNGEPIYWEFGKRELSNRHLVIGGRSGQGKTYFIQSLLKQLSESGQSALIIDYSSSYTEGQLDDAFLASIGDRLEERVVYHQGFPINPFLCREKVVAGKSGPEKITDIASRIQGVFSSVYKNFGDQQKSALYRAAKECLEVYGNKSNMQLLLETLQNLSGTTPSVVASIVSKLALFVDIDPFNYNEEFTWDNYFNEKGKITVIQFEGFEQDDVKKLMTEFILWDLWYYAQDGNDQKPIPVILDEAQNLDFGSGTPSDKILREGRKFGLSVWFATQTFSNFAQAELVALENAATSIFFKPAESELNLIAKKLNLQDTISLRDLRKGECIVQGQFIENGVLSAQKTRKVAVPKMEVSRDKAYI